MEIGRRIYKRKFRYKKGSDDNEFILITYHPFYMECRLCQTAFRSQNEYMEIGCFSGILPVTVKIEVRVGRSTMFVHIQTIEFFFLRNPKAVGFINDCKDDKCHNQYE